MSGRARRQRRGGTGEAEVTPDILAGRRRRRALGGRVKARVGIGVDGASRIVRHIEGAFRGLASSDELGERERLMVVHGRRHGDSGRRAVAALGFGGRGVT